MEKDRRQSQQQIKTASFRMCRTCGQDNGEKVFLKPDKPVLALNLLSHTTHYTFFKSLVFLFMPASACLFECWQDQIHCRFSYLENLFSHGRIPLKAAGGEDQATVVN